MLDLDYIDYSSLDKPQVLACLFHPRNEGMPAALKNAEDLLIPVEDDVAVGARFHHIDKSAPVILFFHGNGEIVADYDELGPFYLRLGINFLPVDYRGYGRSTGLPTVTGMMRDCHIIFKFLKDWLAENSYTGPLIVMGRSLGSASALELAYNYEDKLEGIIIESGFAFAIPLLRLLGIDVEALGISEEDGLGNIDKIRNFKKPTLVIHAEYDHIIPFSDGQTLFDNCTSSHKKMLMIPEANHNTIFACGFDSYMSAIKDFAITVRQQ